MWIRAERVPGGAADVATVRFQVVDTGIGIPEEIRKNLFKEFFQAEASTARRFGGTGLGLAICQRLVWIMGGEIEVDSEPGRGSTFAFTVALPIAPSGTIMSDGVDLSGLRVLFALKNPTLGTLLPRYLERWRAQTAHADHIDRVREVARDAIAKGAPFDIVVFGSAWLIEQQEREIDAFGAEDPLKDVRFLLLSRSRAQADRKELRNAIHVDADPLRRSVFIRAVAVAAGRASPEIEHEAIEHEAPPGWVPTVAEAAAEGQLILVAEDNVTNRDVIRRQLNLLGYAADYTNDGAEALKALDEKSYALLLTDCHMPNLDGFELTKTIRAREVGTATRLPIVAITASVMKVEVERCFESGMNDVLAKPLEINRLKEILRKWMPARARVKSEKAVGIMPPAEPRASEPVDEVFLDLAYLNTTFGGDAGTIKEILCAYVGPSSAIVAALEAAFARRDAAEVGHSAHKLKSSSRVIGATALAKLCEELEIAGKSGDWNGVERGIPALKGLFTDVVGHIQSR